MIILPRPLRSCFAITASVAVAALAAIPAFAARPVARWDVIPDQRISGSFRAGVCAFHEDGVSVEFSLDGEVAYVADAPTLNPRTGVWEYVFPVNTALLPDGPITLGARAYTLAATPEEYILPDLPLYANNGGSLTVSDTLWVDSVNGNDNADGTESAPLLTLKAAVKRIPVGGKVLLKAGEYECGSLGGGSNRPYWTTIAAAPGVARDDIQIAKGRPGTQRLRFQGVSLYCDASSNYVCILDGENGTHSVWLDNCKCYNRQGRWATNANVFGNKYVGYVTGGLTTELNNGPGADLIRGHEVRKIASDVWTGSDKLVVNCTASDVNGGDTGAHPDFHQSHAEEPNWVHDVILYNVTGYNCKCQGLFGVRLRDSAFVNVVFERTVESDFLTQYSGPMENVLFAHVTLVNQTWAWRSSYSPTDVRVYNCCMQRMADMSGNGFDGSGAKGLLISNCFYYNASGVFGQNSTSGDPHFADTNASNYALLPDSPALANFRPFQCIPTDFRGVPFRDTPSGLFTLGGVDSNRFTPPTDRTWPANPGDAEVCLWKGDAFAAGSITIDDNCAYDHDWWLQQARENDLRLTWFVITGNVEGSNPTAGGTWPGWQRIADAGHAVQSHSTIHRGETEEDPYSEADWLSYYGDSKAAIDSHVTNNVCECIAYPGGAGNSVNTNYAARFFIAARGTTGTPNPPAKINYLQVCASSISDPNPYLTVLLGGTVESPAWLNSANYHRGWFVSIVHSVQSNTNTVGALIQAYVSRRPDLWVDTFPSVAKYGQERDTATLATRSVSENNIVLTLADAMDDAVYAEPLTLKIRLPAAWTNLVATQAGTIVRASAVEHDGATYALVNAVPDAGAIVLHNRAPPEDAVEESDDPEVPETPDAPDPPAPPDPVVPATTNIWIGANTTGGTAAQTDLDDPVNWSLSRVPGVGNNDIALFPLHASHAPLDNTPEQAFAPSAILLDCNNNNSSRTIHFGKSLVLSTLFFKPYAGYPGGNSGCWSGRIRIGTNGAERVVLTLTGNGDALDLTSDNAFWGSLVFVGDNPAAIDFTGTNITFSSAKGKRLLDSGIQGGTTAEDASGSSNGTIRFSTPHARIHLADQGPRGTTLGIGTANLVVRSDQIWTADSNAYVRSTARVGPTGVAAPPLVASLDGGRLDNLGALNFVLTRTSGSGSSSTTGQRILGGTYGSLRLAGGNTSRRDATYVLGGDVVLAGHCVLPVSANPHTAEEAEYVSSSSSGTTPYGLQMLTGASQISNWYLDLDGHALVVSNGLQIADAEKATTSTSGSNHPSIRIHALGAHLTVLGDLDIHADNKAATNAVGANATTRQIGIRANAGTVLDLGGSFRSNCRSLYLATSSANNNNNQNFSTATVNLIGGADTERTFEVADASTLDAPARNTFSIGTLNVGTANVQANVRLVNEFLNDNPVDGWTEGTDPANLRIGERLVVGTLSIGPGSRLAVAGQEVRISSAFTMAPSATLDLCIGARLPIDTPVENFRASGNQTAAWHAFAPRVKDSTAPGATFLPAYARATDTTLWVACDFFWGSLILLN